MTEAGAQLIEALEEAAELSPYDVFMSKHVDRVIMWLDAHPPNTRRAKPFPVVKVGDEYVWLNRQMRRRKR